MSHVTTLVSRSLRRLPAGRSISLLGLLVALVPFILAGSLGAQGPGSLDAGFNASTNGGVSVVAAQAGGKILLGGKFTQVNGADHPHVARLNADGSLDAGFNAGTDGNVLAMTVQADGKILLCGEFTRVNASARQGIARLNPDGSLDAGFNANVNARGSVSAVSVQPDGKILLGGGFYQVNDVFRRQVARLNADGSLDGGFVANAEGVNLVSTVTAQADGRIIFAGDFLRVDGAERQDIARLNPDGSLDGGFSPNADGAGVLAVVIQPDGKILLGGSFAQVSKTPRRGIARLNADGSLDGGFNVDQSLSSFGSVTAVVVQADGKIIQGGVRIEVGLRSYLRRLNADGSLDASFNANVDGSASLTAALQPDGKILLGGEFTQVNGVPRQNIARLHATGATVPGVGVVSVTGAPERGGFVVSRAGGAERPVAVAYHNGGSAVRDADYAAFPDTLTFAAGQTEAIIPVRLLPGANRNRKVKVFLDPSPSGAYDINKAQSKVFLSDLP